VTIGALAPTNDTANGLHRYAVRAVKVFLATARSFPSSDRLASCSSVEFPDLPGGTGQVGVIHQRRHISLFGLCEEPAEPQRLFEERQSDVERLLPLLDPKRKLPATQARTDVIVTADAEGIEAERLLPLARDGD